MLNVLQYGKRLRSQTKWIAQYDCNVTEIFIVARTEMRLGMDFSSRKTRNID